MKLEVEAEKHRSVEVEIEVKLEKFESEYIEAEEFEILWWAELSSRSQRNQESDIAAVNFPAQNLKRRIQSTKIGKQFERFTKSRNL